MIKQKIMHPVEYLLFRLVLALVGLCPLSLARWGGRVLGAMAWTVLRVRRDHVLDSLHQAFPGMTPGERKKLGAACYRNLGGYFVDMFRIHCLSTEWMERNIAVEGRGVLDSALEEGRGVVSATFHYCNWELLGAFFARLGYPLDAIVRPQQNRLFDNYVNRMRESSGMRLIPVNSPPRMVVEALKQGRVVVFVADQDAHRVGVFVDFLGRPASTPKGPALYAHKTGAPVVLSIMVPDEENPGKCKIIFEKVPRPGTADRDEFVREMTASYTDRLAQQVRKAPEHWFWPHRRWKTPPPGLP
ncbi:MAG: lysophospholipid acyltransferase family protein [Gemmatimonadota bacterium]|nr:lysophospholipid acyltransferase family protein [Gemmatimonadota bacterium]